MTNAPSSNKAASGRFGDSEHAAIAQRFIDGRSWVADVALSPDGTQVASVIATTSVEENTTRFNVWLDGAPLTAGAVDGNPAWSPDGRFLAFTSRRSEKKSESTIHILPVSGPGEVRTVCTMAEGVGSLAWSPDGRWLAFNSRTPDDRYSEEDVSWQAPRKVERFFSRVDGEDWIFDRPMHVYVVAANGTGIPKNLTEGEFQHAGVAWLADSSGIVTSANRHDTWDRDLAEDIYVVPLANEDLDTDGSLASGIRRLTGTDGCYWGPAVSPDGTRVAFVGFTDPRVFPQNARVGVAPVTADGISADDVTWISDGLDRSFAPMVGGGQAPRWLNDTTVVAIAEDRGDQHAYELTADGSAPPKPLTSGPKTVGRIDVVPGSSVVATLEMDVNGPTELVVNGQTQTSVSASVSAHCQGWDKFTVATTDGTEEIDAWIMRPAGFDADKTYPVLLNVHGGPFAQYGEYFFDEAQMQAAAGFVVVACNPRGSSGRDTAWGQAILGPKHPVVSGTGWGSVDVDDVLAVVDAALKDYSFCDRDRVGMLGGSYGGFMAVWLAAHHGDRFKAICSERAASNLTSLEWSSDIATAFHTEHGVSHLDDPEEYQFRSPVNRAADIDTPMLLIHSEEDWRCPIIQAEELWVALRLMDKEVDFYRFPGEGHELSRSGSPVHRVHRAQIILDWFTDKLG